MKKSISLSSVALLVASITAGQASLAPRQSHAIVAIATGGTAVPALIVLGAGAVAGLVGVPTLGHGVIGGHVNDVYLGAGLAAGGAIAILVGIVLLDEQGAPTAQFQEISTQEAQAAHIGSLEMRAFNNPNQLDRINSVSESIARGIADRKITDPSEAVEFASAEWSAAHAQGLINDRAFTALTKRGTLAASKL